MSDARLINEMGFYASIRLNPPRLEGVNGKSITEGYTFMNELNNVKGEGKRGKGVSLNEGREEQIGPMCPVIATDFPDVICHSREDSW